jgi:hypothetical protein
MFGIAISQAIPSQAPANLRRIHNCSYDNSSLSGLVYDHQRAAIRVPGRTIRPEFAGGASALVALSGTNAAVGAGNKPAGLPESLH